MTPWAATAISTLLLLQASSSAPVVRELTWTWRSESLAHVLTHAPGECLGPGPLSEEAELGRTLFRSSALLGGPAARMSMSCQSCHLNGRNNPHFFLAELTNQPGRADVTSEWSSAVRGDGILNPRLIPDLAGVAGKQTFGSDGEPSLEAFVRSVVVEEFQGSPPSARTLEGLVAYLRALKAEHCPTGDIRVSLASAAHDVSRGGAAGQASARLGDAESASMALFAAQEGLGRIVERLPPRTFADDRRTLEQLSRELAAVRAAADFEAALGEPGWRVRFDAAVGRISRRERHTYFNEAALAQALNAPLDRAHSQSPKHRVDNHN